MFIPWIQPWLDRKGIVSFRYHFLRVRWSWTPNQWIWCWFHQWSYHTNPWSSWSCFVIIVAAIESNHFIVWLLRGTPVRSNESPENHFWVHEWPWILLWWGTTSRVGSYPHQHAAVASWSSFVDLLCVGKRNLDPCCRYTSWAGIVVDSLWRLRSGGWGPTCFCIAQRTTTTTSS